MLGRAYDQIVRFAMHDSSSCQQVFNHFKNLQAGYLVNFKDFIFSQISQQFPANVTCFKLLTTQNTKYAADENRLTTVAFH